MAAQLGCSTATVGKWRRRFVEKRLDGLTDEPRPGGPRSVRDDVIEQVVVETLERTPRDATHWSRSSMAADSGLSASTVGRIWRAFGLKPHLVDTFKLSNDPLFIEKVRGRWSGQTGRRPSGPWFFVVTRIRDPGAEPFSAVAARDDAWGR